MVKSLREAKLHSTWAAPDEAYEEAVLSFVRDASIPSRAEPVSRQLPAVPGADRPARRRNTAVQTLVKLTLPGMPDLYQGSELWDLSLVDPDNRRPVDYGLRRGC